jgi:thiosulfate/3-mercaptopyruvate sulfurtransferase
MGPSCNPEVLYIDASWHMPHTGRSGYDEYLLEHIPLARFIDIDSVLSFLTVRYPKLASPSPLPHMLPSIEQFEAEMSRQGIKRNDTIVVYDTAGLGAARVYWMFKVFGHDSVSVLDGGLTAWIETGGDTTGCLESFEVSVPSLSRLSKVDKLQG